MKKLLILATLFFTFIACKAQINIYADEVNARTFLGIPVLDTLTAGKKLGELRVRPQDTLTYKFNGRLTGKKWDVLDSKFKLNISDTSSMLTNYLRKVDTTGKWITHVYRRIDSVFYTKGGQETFAFIDSGSAGGGGGGLTSVGLSVPAAFTVANSPLIANGTLNMTAIGTALQYIRGDGTLATFDTAAIPNFSFKVRSRISASAPFSYDNVTGILTIADGAADATTKGVSTYTANDFNSVSGLISIDYTNGQAANGSTKGFLTSADWTTFNNKLSAVNLDTVTAATNITITNTGGTDPVLPLVNFVTTKAGLMSPVDKGRLDSLYSGFVTDSIRLSRISGTDSIYLYIKPYGSSTEDSVFQYLDSIGTGGGGGITNIVKSRDSLFINSISPSNFRALDSLAWIKSSYVIVDTTVNHKRNDAGSMRALGVDTLIHLFSRFGNLSGDFDTSRIYRQFSYDRGRTWTTPQIVIADGELGDMIPSIEILPNGDIICVYLHNINSTTNQIRKRVSTDRGQTFGASTTIHAEATRYYSPAGDRLGYLKNGTLFYTFAMNTAPPLTSQTGNYITRFLWSTDNGANWTLGSDDVDSPDSLSVEAGWVQLQDTTIVVYMRSRSNYMNVATSTNNGVSFSMTSMTNLRMPNSTVTLYYDEQLRSYLAIHNEEIGGPTPVLQRKIMLVSVSNDLYTWKTVYVLDSATNFHFIEPYVIKYRDEYLIGYSKGDNATGNYYQIKLARIPTYAIMAAATPTSNVFNNIDIAKGFNNGTAEQLRIFSRKLGATAGFISAGGQTSGDGSYNPWLRFRGSSLTPLIQSEVPGGQAGLRFNAFVTGGSAIANTTQLYDFQSNGTTKFSVYADGRIRLASFAGDVTSPANGDVWYNSTTNKYRAHENGVTVDVIGSGGGAFIASNGATTLTGNADITQGGNRFSLNEELLIGKTSGTPSIYSAEIRKTGAANTILLEQIENNANGNIIRADKTRGASNYAITATDKILEFNGNSIATFGLYAGSLLGSDNFRNAEFIFRSRLDNEAIADRLRITSDGTVNILKKGGTGAGANTLALFLSDQSTSNAFFRISNGTTGTGGAATFINTLGLGSFAGYGISFDLNTTAANAGFDINVHNASTAIADGNDLFEIKNNGSSRLLLNGAGRLGVGVTSPTARLHLPAGTATASTAPLKFTSGTNLTTAEAGVWEFDGTNFYASPSTTRKRMPLINNATPSNGQLAIGNGTDFTVASLTSADGSITITPGAGTLNIATTVASSSGVYTPTITTVANLSSATAPAEWSYIRIGSQVYVWGSVDVDPTTTATTTEVRFSLPIAASFADENECAGTAVFTNATGNEAGAILAETTNEQALLRWTTTTTASQRMFFSFGYRLGGS